MKSKNFFIFLLIFLLAFLVFSTNAKIINASNEQVDNEDIKEEDNSNKKIRSPDDWTFLVYLDADNNLESAGINDFLEMSSVGSDANIQIVVQFDRISGYDSSYDGWTTTKRFNITADMTPTSANALSDLGELNMGNPTTLSDFIIWGVSNFPADHYALILWDHGAGWKSSNEESVGATKAVCYDDTSLGDSLTLAELKTALSTAGITIDLLGFDACFMAMAEVDYQIKDWADVRVGSEEVEPGDGWPYDTILADLINTPTMNANTLGQTIVNNYILSYPSATIETQSAVDLTQENSLASSIDGFAQALKNGVDLYNIEIISARATSEETSYERDFIDLYDFAEEIYNGISNITIQNAAQDVMSNITSMVIAEQHGSSHPDFHGITIYYPETSGMYDSDYETMLDFTADLSWDEFLQAYYGGVSDDAYEENDDRLSAYNLSSYEQTWLSSISGYGIQADNDWYEIYITPSDERLIVSLLFTDAEGDIDIAVYNSSGLFETGSDSITDNEYINYVLPSSGTYYLLVYYDDESNTYDLWWDDVNPGTGGDDPYEPNDDYWEAYDLSSHESVWLSSINGLGIQSNNDWYKIYVTLGKPYLHVDLTFSHVLGDIDIDVFDAYGYLITYSWSITDNEYIDVVLTSSGIYYLCVYWDDAGNSYDLRWYTTSTSTSTDGGGGGGGGDDDDDIFELIPGYDLSILIGSLLGSVVVASIIISKNCKRNYRK